MTKKTWKDLAKLADLAFEIQSKKLAVLKDQEAQVIEKRQQLTDMNNGAMAALSGVHPAHYQSGDFHWQTWVGANKQKLGSEQALLRAQAEMLKPDLRKAFGRKSVLAKLIKQETR